MEWFPIEDDDEYWEEIAYDIEPVPCEECGQAFWSWYAFDNHECF